MGHPATAPAGIPGCLGPLSYAGPHTLIAARGPPAVRASDALRPAALALPDPLTDIGLLPRARGPPFFGPSWRPGFVLVVSSEFYFLFRKAKH